MRAAQVRLGDFREIYRPFAPASAQQQASRCAQCGVPFCQNACPLHNSIPDWLRMTAEGRLQEAHELAASTNPMPEICGRICPQDRLCEGDCVIEQSDHGAVTIGAIEKHIVELAWDNGWVAPLVPGTERGQSVGVIGAGPAGLAAAESLRTRGYRVTVYDRHDRAGGLLIYGIPGFKLEKPVVARRVNRLEKGGIGFQLGCEIGKDLLFAQIRARHDAIVIATGVYGARPLPVTNTAAAVPALDYLIAANRAEFGTPLGALSAQGRRVLVIGGGDTAMDCVRTAVRQRAASVTCLYRRDQRAMPGSRREVLHAQEEGVAFEWLCTPTAIRRGKTPGVKALRMRPGAADGGRRSEPQAIPDSAFTIAGEMVIAALGYDAEPLPALWRLPDLARTAQGTLKVDARGATSLPGVFAAGDIVRGASLVVWALRAGLDCADGVHAYLEAQAACASIAAQ